MEFIDTDLLKQFKNVEKSSAEILNKLIDLTNLQVKLYKEESKVFKRKLVMAILVIGSAIVFGLSSISIATLAIAEYIVKQSISITHPYALAALSIILFVITFGLIFLSINIVKQISLIPLASINTIKESFSCLINSK